MSEYGKIGYRENSNDSAIGIVTIGDWALVLPKETAIELVRRWNAFEEDGIVEELVEVIKELLRVYDPYDTDIRFLGKRITIKLKAEEVVAKAKPEQNPAYHA